MPKEELHDLYCSPDIVRVITLRRLKWEEHGVRMGDKRTAYRDFVRKHEGKRQLGRLRREGERVAYCTDLAQDRPIDTTGDVRQCN